MNSSLSTQALRERIEHHAKALSLEIGYARVEINTQDQVAFKKWLAQGYHGDMAFMADNQHLRYDPTQLLAGCVSIISARLPYWSSDVESLAQLSEPNSAYISRYALGRDYHKVLRAKLKQLCVMLSNDIGEFLWRPFSDSAPILEHSVARQAGLGFIGKHSLLIHPEAGSTFFLGEILCDLPLFDDQNSTPLVKPSCGSCTQCMDLCPTKAIVEPYVVDATRCISYLTIEFKGAIPLALRTLMGNRIYGCDDCQLACPWNKFAQMTQEIDFLPRHGFDRADLLALWQWSESDFLTLTEGSAIRRIGYTQWRRNLAVALGNTPSDPTVLLALEQALPTADALVSEHISWAIQQQMKPNQRALTPLIQRSFLP